MRHAAAMTGNEAPLWPAAMQQLDVWQRAAEVLALLQGATSAGLLTRLAQPATEDDLIAGCGLSGSRVRAVLGVLEAHGVIQRSLDGWVLAPAWAPLVLEQTPLRFEATLGMGRVRSEQLGQSVGGGASYWQLSAADRLLVARGVSPDPAAPATVATVGDVASMAGVQEALEQGGRLLELGCGIGSRLCGVLRAFPAATGVGVELDADLVAEGRRMAAGLGLADRLTYVHADATTYDGGAAFDLVQWSQFFFPTDTRAGALAAALRALRPGGWISLPAVWDGEPPESGSDLAQELAAERLVLDLWGVPLRSAPELVAELAAVGFVELHVQPGPMVSHVRGRRAG